MTDAGWVKAEPGGDGQAWQFGGAWTLAHANALDDATTALKPGAGAVTLDLSALEMLDTAGAWLIMRTAERAGAGGAKVGWIEPPAALLPLFKRVLEAGPEPVEEPARRVLFLDWLADVGAATEVILKEALDLIAFFGALVETLGRIIVQPKRLRWVSVVSHIERTGLNALPIVGMISFLVGVVLAFQGADQLRRFGAQVFTINMVGISVLREMGILLTAIVVAGRSGSAFTAEIGAMQVNEEVDALRVTGLDPMEVLVAPRVLALMIALPLLTVFTDVTGILGGMVMARAHLDVSFSTFINRLDDAISLTSYLIGIGKAPVFAVIISLVGCYQGFQVSGSADSVGRQTTVSVVQSIFLVIVTDSLFSIVFSALEI